MGSFMFAPHAMSKRLLYTISLGAMAVALPAFAEVPMDLDEPVEISPVAVVANHEILGRHPNGVGRYYRA